MGSGSERKRNDRVSIQEPIAKGSGGGGAQGGSESEAPTCPLYFRVKLPKEARVPTGARLDLKKENGLLTISFNSKTITKLSKNRSEEIEDCLGQGFRYTGLAKLDGDEPFAEFTRG